jgi:hypothetical protein
MNNKMMILRFAVVWSLISTFAVLPFKAASAEIRAKCRVPSVEEAYKNSKAVFIGEILNVVKDGDVKTFTFKVEKRWKGAAGKQIKINVQETSHYQAWFEVGDKYLVYARGSEKDEKLWEVRCSRSKPLTDASEDITELGRVKKPSKNKI